MLLSSDAVPEAATPGTADLSGLTPCAPPPAVDWQNVSGDPAHTITSTSAVLGTDPASSGAPEATAVGTAVIGGSAGSKDWTITIISDPSKQPWMDFPNLPSGQPAPTDAISGINETLAGIRNCDQPGITTDASGYFSEDFYRRSWVQSLIAQVPDQTPLNLLSISAGAYWLNEIQSVTVLADGRVAVVGQPGGASVDNFAMLVIFVQHGDTWVIDESIRVGIGALMG